ncbi:MAG: cupin domain-containing protein, partial [Solirubrobacterales bacterium]|nr:cupin domain-containing protein [Solirubrobacterales bacterium]
MEPQFISLANAQGFQLAAGAVAKPLFGEGAMLNLVELEPDAVVALHSHPHEQLGIVLRGSMKLVVAGVDHELA